MRAFLAAIVLALVLGATPTVAFADEGDDQDVTKASDDPGITALHKAIDEMRDARTALRTDCPNMGDPKCRAEFRKVRDAFKNAHDKAIEAHHAFKDAEKKARDEAKQKAKDVLKDKAAKAKDAHKNGTPSATPRG
jgi:hypothetical protein